MFGSRAEQRKNWEAFESEALPFMGDVFRLAMYLVRDRDKAEDLVQETFSNALTSFHRYEMGTNCRAWLSTILYNVHKKHLRNERRLKFVEDMEERIAETIAFEPPIPQRLTDDEILAALDKVPEQFRTAVLLTDVEGFSYKEASSLLKVPIGTVMSRLHRGRRLLRIELAEYATKTRLIANRQV